MCAGLDVARHGLLAVWTLSVHLRRRLSGRAGRQDLERRFPALREVEREDNDPKQDAAHDPRRSAVAAGTADAAPVTLRRVYADPDSGANNPKNNEYGEHQISPAVETAATTQEELTVEEAPADRAAT